jgi:hypothetical protein
MSHKCQFLTHAAQQTTCAVALFDRLIDAQQKRFRDFEPEGLGRCQLRAPQRRARLAGLAAPANVVLSNGPEIDLS